MSLHPDLATMTQGWDAIVATLRAVANALAQALYPTVEVPRMTDKEAITSDWRAVGDDMRRAIREVRESHPTAPKQQGGTP